MSNTNFRKKRYKIANDIDIHGREDKLLPKPNWKKFFSLSILANIFTIGAENI
jgi:hypothetical protein